MGTTSHSNHASVGRRGWPLLARVRERLFAGRLDQELAAGADPGASPALRLHSERLCNPRQREDLAKRLREAVTSAFEGPRPLSAAVPVRAHAVREASDEVEDLACQLTAPWQVDARGVALTRLLLTDGSGPLYNPAEEHRLLATVREAHRALRGELG
jgi:hypothetical protein